MIPTIQVGNNLELWLSDQWDSLLGIERRNVSPVIEKINSFIGQLRRDPSSINSNMRCVKESGQPSLANYLGSLQYIDGNNYRRGPWSFMTDSEWNTVAKIMDDECSARDAEAARYDFTDYFFSMG